MKDQRFFEAKDIREILGVKPEEVHLWSRTWGLFKPAIRGKAHGKNKYSAENLMQMTLIKELLGWGFQLKAIKEILTKVAEVQEVSLFFAKPDKPIGPTVWEYIAASEAKYRREGFLLVIQKEPGILSEIRDPDKYEREPFAVAATPKTLLQNIRMFNTDSEGNYIQGLSGMLLIDLMEIYDGIHVAIEAHRTWKANP